MYIDKYDKISRIDATLRPYQQKAKQEIFGAWDKFNNVMFQMPTGTGKTRLFTSIIKDINEYSIQNREAVKILIIAHRTELIDQIDDSLKKYAIPHNVIAGGVKKNWRLPVNVASIQTITHPNNIDKAKQLDVQFIIIDEAHHAKARTYKKLWELFPKSKKLGVTATPWRMNHSGFKDLFQKLILSMPVKEFIKKGYLSPYKYFSLKDDSDIQTTIDHIELDQFGEYKENSMEQMMDIGKIRAQLLNSYLALAEGKKGIIYAININHAKHISKEYEDAGYNVVAIDSKTPSKERRELVTKFKRGDIDIIVNVDIFSEGFDCPDIEFIQLARPTRSLVKYLQQVGRGLRKVEGKEDCIILDNVGMYSRFGLPDAKRFWNYHFEGHAVIEPLPVQSIGTGVGVSRDIDMTEGTEDMILIQEIEHQEIEEPEQETIVEDIQVVEETNDEGNEMSEKSHSLLIKNLSALKSKHVCPQMATSMLKNLREELISSGYDISRDFDVFMISIGFYDAFVSDNNLYILKYMKGTETFDSPLSAKLIVEAPFDSDLCKDIISGQIQRFDSINFLDWYPFNSVKAICKESKTGEMFEKKYKWNGSLCPTTEDYDIYVNEDDEDQETEDAENRGISQEYFGYKWHKEDENLKLIQAPGIDSDSIIAKNTPKGDFVVINGKVFDIYNNGFNNHVIEEIRFIDHGYQRKVVAYIRNSNKLLNYIKEGKVKEIANFGDEHTIIQVQILECDPIYIYDFDGDECYFYTSLQALYRWCLLDGDDVSDIIVDPDVLFVRGDLEWNYQLCKKSVVISSRKDFANIIQFTVGNSSPDYTKLVDNIQRGLLQVRFYKDKYEFCIGDKDNNEWISVRKSGKNKKKDNSLTNDKETKSKVMDCLIKEIDSASSSDEPIESKIKNIIALSGYNSYAYDCCNEHGNNNSTPIAIYTLTKQDKSYIMTVSAMKTALFFCPFKYQDASLLKVYLLIFNKDNYAFMQSNNAITNSLECQFLVGVVDNNNIDTWIKNMNKLYQKSKNLDCKDYFKKINKQVNGQKASHFKSGMSKLLALHAKQRDYSMVSSKSISNFLKDLANETNTFNILGNEKDEQIKVDYFVFNLSNLSFAILAPSSTPNTFLFVALPSYSILMQENVIEFLQYVNKGEEWNKGITTCPFFLKSVKARRLTKIFEYITDILNTSQPSIVTSSSKEELIRLIMESNRPRVF